MRLIKAVGGVVANLCKFLKLEKAERSGIIDL